LIAQLRRIYFRALDGLGGIEAHVRALLISLGNTQDGSIYDLRFMIADLR
jgi:hypothetical protein